MLLSSNTELEAVNTIIGALGEMPLSSLEDSLNVDAINAYRILQTTNRQQQARGWSFNIHEDYVLNPDSMTGRIKWAENFLFLRGTEGTKYTKQGDYVYDFTNKTANFTQPITVTAIFLMPLEELPDALRNFIVAKAALTFQIRYLGEPNLTQSLQEDVQEAWQALQEYELDTNDYSLLDNDNVVTVLER